MEVLKIQISKKGPKIKFLATKSTISQIKSGFLIIFYLDFFKKNLFFQKSKMAENSTFYLENLNSETTFISPTFKVEEIKVVSEFRFCV